MKVMKATRVEYCAECKKGFVQSTLVTVCEEQEGRELIFAVCDSCFKEVVVPEIVDNMFQEWVNDVTKRDFKENLQKVLVETKQEMENSRERRKGR